MYSPDTAELGTRFGVHSGPVTGGVLRGDKSRFQLFGDTVNTAARIESTGARNRVHLSKETADLLKEAGYGSWITPRNDVVVAKGKGEIQTYWLKSGTGSVSASSNDMAATPSTAFSEDSNLNFAPINNHELDTSGRNGKLERLIGWNVDVLQRSLKHIVAMRGDSKPQQGISTLKIESKEGGTVLDEVKEIIPLSSKAAKYKRDPASVELDAVVVSQLTDYVRAIAAMYRDNAFHNFQHASHVSQSMTKLLSRVVTPETIDYQDMTYKKKGEAALHEFTYGITSDPLIQFACAFSALIHDADHPGVPNVQLVKEGQRIAEIYGNKR